MWAINQSVFIPSPPLGRIIFGKLIYLLLAHSYLSKNAIVAMIADIAEKPVAIISPKIETTYVTESFIPGNTANMVAAMSARQILANVAYMPTLLCCFISLLFGLLNHLKIMGLTARSMILSRWKSSRGILANSAGILATSCAGAKS